MMLKVIHAGSRLGPAGNHMTTKKTLRQQYHIATALQRVKESFSWSSDYSLE